MLQVLATLRGPDLLRMKGIVHVKGEPGPVVIQGAQHLFHPPVTLEPRREIDSRSRIVFIVRDIPRATIEALFAAVNALGSPSPRAPQSCFDDGASPRRLEIIQVGQNGIVHRERQVVRDGADFPFRAPAQIRIHFFRFGNRDFGNFIDGRRRGFLLAETVAVPERLESIHIQRFYDVAIQVAEARIRVDIKTAGKHLVERLIELLPRLIKPAGAEVLLSGVEDRLAPCHKPLNSIRREIHQWHD